ncbi:unnamed protein product [Prunus brigantina]
MMVDVARKIGMLLGQVAEVDHADGEDYIGRFALVRIKFDVNQPLMSLSLSLIPKIIKCSNVSANWGQKAGPPSTPPPGPSYVIPLPYPKIIEVPPWIVLLAFTLMELCLKEKSTTVVLLSCPKHGDRRSRKTARKAIGSNRSSKGPYCGFAFKARFRKATGSGNDASGNLWSGRRRPASRGLQDLPDNSLLEHS